MNILDQLDRAIDGLCPCGADPRPNSAYCGDDCVPNTRAADTTSHYDGTPMRWRPDLVTAVDDSRLTLIAEFPVAHRYGAIYEIAGSDSLHLRLDDEHRWVGVDVAPDQAGDPSIEPGLRRELDPVWQRLERELTDRQRLEPGGQSEEGEIGPCPCGCNTIFFASNVASSQIFDRWRGLGHLAEAGIMYADDFVIELEDSRGMLSQAGRDLIRSWLMTPPVNPPAGSLLRITSA